MAHGSEAALDVSANDGRTLDRIGTRSLRLDEGKEAFEFREGVFVRRLGRHSLDRRKRGQPAALANARSEKLAKPRRAAAMAIAHHCVHQGPGALSRRKLSMSSPGGGFMRD